MATIHVRNVPEKLHKKIQRLSLRNRRSLSAEIVNLLDQASELEEVRRSQTKLLDTIRRRRQRRKPAPGGADRISSLDLLREDRAR